MTKRKEFPVFYGELFLIVGYSDRGFSDNGIFLSNDIKTQSSKRLPFQKRKKGRKIFIKFYILR